MGETGKVDGARRTLGETIAALRRERGLSQDELAKVVGVSRSIVSAWERDDRRPRRDKLAVLGDAIGLPHDAAALGANGERGDHGPVLPAATAVNTLLRHAADGLIANLSEDTAVDGFPGHGWRREVDDASQQISAMATAYGLQALLLAGARDWRVDIRELRGLLRRLELPEGGWSGLTGFGALPRPEVTAVVIGALSDAGEDRDYIAERIYLLISRLRRRVEGAERARPYVLTTSLLELSRLELDEVLARRFLDDLVDLAIPDGVVRAWPVRVDSAMAGSDPSTVHTAAAVRALAAWAIRLNDDWLWEVAVSGRLWLERYADLDLDSETLRIERADGTEDLHTVNHFTPALVLRAIVDAGGDGSGPVARQARRETLRYYQPQARLWRWPTGGGQYPVWMTYQGIAALKSWALSRPAE
ncbi:MAG TPA: helix-turn-helix domain-containing protein [Acidimicrobiales bacterium]|nr:helix-turn-helix domain-containing protein [Acidimicrobiales bacterium]